MERLLSLSEYDIDFSEGHEMFKNLATLAAKVTGTSISMVNLIDSLTQWTVSNYGLNLDQMLREDSICQYTIMETDSFEVTDLTSDSRFKDKGYVTGDPNVRYYYGVPLKTSKGLQIGALCVLDKEQKHLDPEQTELMKIIADEIVNRLKTAKTLEILRLKLNEARQIHKKVAHDIRGPLGGIVGLAKIIEDQGENNQMPEVLEFASLIHKSGSSILELALDILKSDSQTFDDTPFDAKKESNRFKLITFKDKLVKLYGPQAVHKGVILSVNTHSLTENILVSKSKLVQITGNLISNSIKFTPVGGTVTVDLELSLHLDVPTLHIIVSDSGVGISDAAIEAILDGHALSTSGTMGEEGFGFGLALVKHLVDGLEGSISFTSEAGKGTKIEIVLPQVLY